MRTRYVVAVGIVALIGATGPASGQSVGSLRGIGPVNVELVAPMPRAADGETSAPDIALGRLLLAAVQDRLEQREIPLHEKAPILRVIVTGFPNRDGEYAILTEVSLAQLARLGSGESTLATTWDRHSVAFAVAEQELPDTARTEVLRLIDRFADDYLAVNPG